jgi:hypothetical protein
MWSKKINKNRPVSGFFTKIALFQVMNFIPVIVSTLYVRDLLDELNFISRSGVALPFDWMLD